MSRLALAAVLLLVLAPTVNRLLASSTFGPDGLLTPMCTAHGLEFVRLPLGSFDADQTASQAHSHDDCAYCPLLNALTALVLFAVIVFAQAIGNLVGLPRPAQRRSGIHLGSLGARGPPLAA
jgi:hypothetical protein